MYEPSHIKLWTMPDHYFGAVWPGYYVAPCTQHRDSDVISRSNWEVQLKEILPLGEKDDTISVVRESHWSVGWVEWLAIHQDNEAALRKADELAAAIEDYPILDEDDYSEREIDEANEVWRTCFNDQERVAYIRKNRDQFDFHDWRELRQCVKGEYFNGYASELLC